MGLAASQARLLLLTSKNDALELRAQNIEQERLLLAQEQETIAQEYSDATTNMVYQASVTNADGTTSRETLTLGTLAKSMQATGGQGSMVVICDANGNPVCAAQASSSTDADGNVTDSVVSYYSYSNGTWTEVSDTSSLVETLNSNSYNSALQLGLQNGSYQLYVQTDSDGEVQDGITLATMFSQDSGYFCRKSTDSLDCVSSRYYTEDDAAAQAEYQTAMARVNSMDTRLENQLNQVETQKSAVETEMESVSSLIDSNIERTFQYFS